MTAILTIGGIPYTMVEDQHDVMNSVNERQTFQCDVIDYTGTAHFQKGEQVIVTDPLLGTTYSGVIWQDKEVPQYPTGAILHTIQCIDMGQYIAGRRTYTQTYITPQPAGKIAADQLSILLSEGIGQNFAVHNDATQANFTQGNLSNTVATPNLGGDLELVDAGSTVTIIESSTANFASGTLTQMQAVNNYLTPITVNALKMQSTLSFAYGTEFAQATQGLTGTAAGSVSPAGYVTPSGYVTISSGSPGESAYFYGYSSSVSTTGSFSVPLSGSVEKRYEPKVKSKCKVNDKHYQVITVDASVADNRVDAMIWAGSYTIGTNDTLNYDIFISSASPSQEAGVDLYFNDGTIMTEYLGSLDTNGDVGIWDQNHVSISPIQDLSDHAKDAWYTRNVNLSVLVGKIIVGVSLFNSSNTAGVCDMYIKNCYLGSRSGTPFFGTSQTAPQINPPVYTSLGAYITSATLVTVVPVYVPAASSRVSPAYSIDAVKLVQNSVITWSAVVPIGGPGVIAGSPGGATTAGTSNIFVSYDATTWLPCTNGQPLPGLQPGANVAGMSLYLLETFSATQDPSALPLLLQVTITITSASAATTSDIVATYGTTAAWNTGIKEGVAPNANGDLILGLTSYSWANLNEMTWVPGGGSTYPTQSVSSGAYVVSSPGNAFTSWSSTRFNFISAVQDFIAEADFTLSGSSPVQNEIGFVYRQTYWGSPNNSFAYYVRIMQAPGGQAGGTSVSLGYGVNSPPTSNVGGGPGTGAAFTLITQVSVTINSGTSYHAKLVVGENRHTIYWNNGSLPIIDILDNTYTAAGSTGVRTYVQSTNSTTAKMANFTITNTYAGIWLSPAINLNSLGSCGNTQISWSETNNQGDIQSSITVMASLNGGSTWQQCTNGATSSTAIIPGLPVGTSTIGKSLLLQLVLSAISALAAPIITGLYVRVCGAYPGSSGTRMTTPMGNDTMIRSNVVGGLGTAFDGQTYTKIGTGTVALTSNEALLSNTTGAMRLTYGSRTWTDEEATVRFQLSSATIAFGVELRYNFPTAYYRLTVTSTTITLIKNTGLGESTLASTAVYLTINSWYRMRFRVYGNTQVFLYGKIWPDTTLEPGVFNGQMNLTNPGWTITAID